MDLKDYREMPENGLFEKIQRKLALRRALRMGGAVLGVAAVVGTAAVLMWPKPVAEEVAVATVQPAVNETIAAAEPMVADVKVEATEQIVKTTTVMPIDTAITDEDRAWLAAMLPQGTPLVQPLDEKSAESQTVSMGSSITQVDQMPTEVVDIPTATEPTPDGVNAKAGQPVPHFDNVIWAPNVIIPDGELDENRNFSIKATSTITDFHLHIYNRSGRRIYITTDPMFEWNGTMSGGERVPQGAYVWVATFRDTDGNPRQERGTVTVLR